MPDSSPLSWRTISHFRIIEKLVRVAAMGVVYKAEDTKLGRVGLLSSCTARSAEVPGQPSTALAQS